MIWSVDHRVVRKVFNIATNQRINSKKDQLLKMSIESELRISLVTGAVTHQQISN